MEFGVNPLHFGSSRTDRTALYIYETSFDGLPLVAFVVMSSYFCFFLFAERPGTYFCSFAHDFRFISVNDGIYVQSITMPISLLHAYSNQIDETHLFAIDFVLQLQGRVAASPRHAWQQTPVTHNGQIHVVYYSCSQPQGCWCLFAPRVCFSICVCVCERRAYFMLLMCAWPCGRRAAFRDTCPTPPPQIAAATTNGSVLSGMSFMYTHTQTHSPPLHQCRGHTHKHIHTSAICHQIKGHRRYGHLSLRIRRLCAGIARQSRISISIRSTYYAASKPPSSASQPFAKPILIAREFRYMMLAELSPLWWHPATRAVDKDTHTERVGEQCREKWWWWFAVLWWSPRVGVDQSA